MFRNRLPASSDVLRVSSVIATFFYGWTIVVWLWQMPSWLLSLTFSEMTSIFAYAMLTALLETLSVLFFLLFLTFALPPRFLRDDFTIRATWLTIGSLGSLVIFFICFDNFEFGLSLPHYIIPWSIVTLLLAILLAFLSSRFAWMRAAALWVSDRLLVFLFLFVPAFFISLLTVVIRNLF